MNKKERRELEAAPLVIIFANYPYPQYRKKCKQAGADFFFDKATEFQRINEVLKMLSRTPGSGENCKSRSGKKETRSDEI